MLRNMRYSQEAHFLPRSYPSTRRDDARETEGRDREARPAIDRWTPPKATRLPEDGIHVYRWVREYVQGQMDASNMTKAFQEGFVAVMIEDLPPGFLVDHDLHGDGIARHGGLVLMRMPKHLHEQREAYYRERRQLALRGANDLQGVASAENGSRRLPVDVVRDQRATVGLRTT